MLHKHGLSKLNKNRHSYWVLLQQQPPTWKNCFTAPLTMCTKFFLFFYKLSLGLPRKKLSPPPSVWATFVYLIDKRRYELLISISLSVSCPSLGTKIYFIFRTSKYILSWPSGPERRAIDHLNVPLATPLLGTNYYYTWFLAQSRLYVNVPLRYTIKMKDVTFNRCLVRNMLIVQTEASGKNDDMALRVAPRPQTEWQEGGKAA